MPDWFAIIALGIVEGITEFLPISSTGHLLLAEHWLGHQSDLFNVVIQSGAVLAVLLIFTERLKQIIFKWREPANFDYLLKLAGAFVITGVGGLILDHKHVKLPETVTPIAIATLVGGVLILAIEWWTAKRPLRGEVTWGIAVAVGLAQLVAAVFPGTSRSASTILIALVMGLSRPAATEFSFLLGIPTLLAATGLKTFHALRHPPAEAIHWDAILVATAVAAVTAFIAVRWLLRYIQSHTFSGFGWYRIALGVVFLALAGMGKL